MANTVKPYPAAQFGTMGDALEMPIALLRMIRWSEKTSGIGDANIMHLFGCRQAWVSRSRLRWI